MKGLWRHFRGFAKAERSSARFAYSELRIVPIGAPVPRPSLTPPPLLPSLSLCRPFGPERWSGGVFHPDRCGNLARIPRRCRLMNGRRSNAPTQPVFVRPAIATIFREFLPRVSLSVSPFIRSYRLSFVSFVRTVAETRPRNLKVLRVAFYRVECERTFLLVIS